MNIFYFDCETGGLDSSRHALLQFAYIIEVDGQQVKRNCFSIKPDRNDDISIAALEVNDIQVSGLLQGEALSKVIYTLRGDLQVALQGSKSVYFYPCGHNVLFDIGFLKQAVKKTDEQWLNSLVDFHRPIDTRLYATILDYKGLLHLDNYTLETCCRHFGIPLRPHDALEDITATRELLRELRKLDATGDFNKK